MARLINRPALIAWVAAVRFLSQVGTAVKAASTAEDLLNIRLQNLFNKVNAEVVSQIEKRGGNIPGIMRNAAGEMSTIIYEEIRKVDKGMNPQVQDQLRTYAFQASQRTMERLTGDVMDRLSKAYADGLGTIEAADLIAQDFKDMTDWELKRVARTEVNSAQGLNNFNRMKTAGVKFIQWISAEDERVRATPQANHKILHGQIVRLGNKFSNGLLHPGDRSSGKLAEFINCRCSAVPFILPRGFVVPGDGSAPFYESDLIAIQPTKDLESMASLDSRNKSAQSVADRVVMSDAKSKAIGPKYDPIQTKEAVRETVANFNAEFANGLDEGLGKIKFGPRMSADTLGVHHPAAVLGNDYIDIQKLKRFGSMQRMKGTLIHEMGHNLDHMFDISGGSYTKPLLFSKLSPAMQKGVETIKRLSVEGYERQINHVRSVMGDAAFNKLKGKRQWYFKLPNGNYDIITEYSLANKKEFFCEALKMYRLNPKVLSRLHPDLFNAIRDIMFDGRGF